jgi:Bacterial Ig-like domain (group 2)
MIKHQKAMLAIALLLTALVPVTAGAATAPPKVVFYGDQFTLGWTSAFAANPNWINKGAPTIYTSSSMDSALAGFESDVVSLHPAIVHIMFGETDSEDMSSNTTQFYGPGVLSDAQAMVAEAKAANIKVVFGLEPNALSQYKQIITMYGAAHNIPVINYGDALSVPGSESFAGTGLTVGFGNYADVLGYNTSNPNPYLMPDPNGNVWPVPTVTGYALMTQMAEAIINPMGLTLQGGYLQNTSNFQGEGLTPNINQMVLFQQAQFTPYGYYNGGLVEPFTNTNYFTGASGTWASSNPLVMEVNQTGHVWALTVGKTNITYTSPTGVRFSEWTMTVESYGNQLGPSTL